MELGLLAENNLKGLEIRTEAKDVTPALNTSSSRESAEDKSLRLSCASNLVLGCMQFNSVGACMYVRLSLSRVEPLERWHGHQNAYLRSAEEASAQWTIDQLQGGFMNVLYDIVGRIADESALSSVPFGLPRPGRSVSGDESLVLEDEREDKFASVMADGALILVGLRLQLMLWLVRGWPCRLALVLHSDALGALAIDAFRKDWDNFRASGM